MKTIYALLLASAAILFTSCCEKCEGINEFENSGLLISKDRASRLIDNYRTSDFMKGISYMQNQGFEREGFLPTEYLWVSIDDIKDYICMLEEVERLNPNEGEVTGIAINFARYGNDERKKNDTNLERKNIRPDVTEGDYRGRMTTVLNPTFLPKGEEYKNLNNHVQFFIRPDDPAKKYVGTYLPLLNEKEYVAEYFIPAMFQDKEDTSLAMNELNAMPPKRN